MKFDRSSTTLGNPVGCSPATTSLQTADDDTVESSTLARVGS